MIQVTGSNLHSEEKKLSVCLANDSFPPLIDGVANTVFNYARTITSKYGSAVVATPDYPGVKDEYSFDVVRYRSINTSRVFGYRTGTPFNYKTMSALQKYAPDIIHSHCPLASSFLCRELRNLTGAPLVFTYHTKFDIDFARALKIGLLKDAAIKTIIDNIGASDEVWAVNRGAADNLKSLGFDRDIRIMPNGVDFPRGPMDRAEALKLLEDVGINSGPPVFLFVGRMVWYKGQRYIIEGCRKASENGYRFSMVFVGDGEDLEEIKKEAANAGISDLCVFPGAERDRDRLRAYYSIADALFLPSVFDNNPIVVKEAAACSTASVLIRGSSSAEGATDGVNAVLTEESGDDIAKAIMTLSDDRNLAKKLGENALRDLYASWEDMIDAAVTRYMEIINAVNTGEIKPRKKMPTDIAIDAIADITLKIEQLLQKN